MNQMKFDEYEKVYQQNIWKLFPNFNTLQLTSSDTEGGFPMEYLIKLYIEWFRCISDDVCFLMDGVYYTAYVRYGKTKHDAIGQFVASEIANELTEKSKRVLGLLCLGLSLQRSQSKLEPFSLIRDFCAGLSIHDLNETQQETICLNLEKILNTSDRSPRYCSFKYIG
ncbi:uncharacterized protein LOC144745117 [Ciona intestinalis]